MIQWIHTMDPETYMYSGIGLWFVSMIGWFYSQLNYCMELWNVETFLFAAVSALLCCIWPATLVVAVVGLAALITAVVLGLITG